MIITQLRINIITCSWCHIKAPALCYPLVPLTPYYIFPTCDSLCTDESLIWLTGLAEVVSICFRQPKLITRDNNDLYHFLYFIWMLGCKVYKRGYSHTSLVINCLPIVNCRCEGGGREGVTCLATPTKITRREGHLKVIYVAFMYSHISNPGNASNVRLDPKLAQCRTSVYDVVPTSNQHKLYGLRLLIIHIYK